MLGRYYNVFSIINKYIRNRYWLVGFVLLFLLGATAYLIFIPRSYKITTRILLNNKQYPEEAIQDLKSKFLIRKVIDQLPMVRYYHKELFKQTELNEESLPFKLIFPKYRAVDSSAQVVVTVLNNQQYEINQDNVLMDLPFDKPVKYYSFAKFTVVKGPAFKDRIKPVTLIFKQPDQLLEEYYNNLNAKFVDNDRKIIELSLITPSIGMGKDFLNKLVSVYNQSRNTANLTNLPVATYNIKNLQKTIKKEKEVATYSQVIDRKEDDEYVITYPKTGYVYLFALLVGMTLALIIPHFKLPLRYD
jgi:Chain length determinant protein